MKKGITIKARIGLTMAFLAALLIAIGVFGLFGMSHSNDAYKGTFTNQMPSAVDIGNAELYAARERLTLDRAAFMAGSPETASTIERAHLMRTTSDMCWKKYIDLPRDPEEDRLAQDVSAHRDTLQAMDTFAATNDQSKVVDNAKRLQATYNDLSNAATTRCASSVRVRETGLRGGAKQLLDVPLREHHRTGARRAGVGCLVSRAEPRDCPSARRSARSLRRHRRRRPAPLGRGEFT